MTAFLSIAVLLASLALGSGSPAAQGLAVPTQLRPFDTALPPLVGEDYRFPAVRGRGICSTPDGWCPLDEPSRVLPTSPCYCISGGQQIMGVAAARDYYGNVNPWFNPWRELLPAE